MRAALVNELKRLRKGRGVMNPAITSIIGPELRRLCGIDDRDEPAAVRGKLTSTLSDLAARLPEDLRPAVAAAFALPPHNGQPLLKDRTAHLAALIRKDERTARRRVDDVCELIADADDLVSTRDLGSWYVDTFRALVRLDSDAPEVVEERRIVATAPITQIEVSLSLPRGLPERRTSHDLHITVLYGGRLLRRDRLSTSHFRYVIELPAALRRGQSHDYSLRLRVPHGQVMRQHYVFAPHRRCDHFEVRVRFSPVRPPRSLWRVDGLPIRVVDDAVAAGSLLSLDRAGEVLARFSDMSPGLGYGVQWRM